MIDYPTVVAVWAFHLVAHSHPPFFLFDRTNYYMSFPLFATSNPAFCTHTSINTIYLIRSNAHLIKIVSRSSFIVLTRQSELNCTSCWWDRRWWRYFWSISTGKQRALCRKAYRNFCNGFRWRSCLSKNSTMEGTPTEADEQSAESDAWWKQGRTVVVSPRSKVSFWTAAASALSHSTDKVVCMLRNIALPAPNASCLNIVYHYSNHDWQGR